MKMIMGNWYLVSGEFERVDAEEHELPFFYLDKLHKSFRIWKYNPTSPVVAMYIGKRTISNGSVEYFPEYGETVYMPQQHQTAYLFVSNERGKPFMIHPDHVSLIPDDIEKKHLSNMKKGLKYGSILK